MIGCTRSVLNLQTEHMCFFLFFFGVVFFVFCLFFFLDPRFLLELGEIFDQKDDKKQRISFQWLYKYTSPEKHTDATDSQAHYLIAFTKLCRI